METFLTLRKQFATTFLLGLGVTFMLQTSIFALGDAAKENATQNNRELWTRVERQPGEEDIKIGSNAEKPMNPITEDDSKNETSKAKDIRHRAVLVAAVGALGLMGAATLKNMRGKTSYEPKNAMISLRETVGEGEDIIPDFNELEETLENVVPNKNGIYIEEKERNEILNAINEVSAIQYTVDKSGFITADPTKAMNSKNSMKASRYIDQLIHAPRRTILALDDTFYRLNADGIRVSQEKLEGGIHIGDEETGNVIILDKDTLSGINILHELGHALENESEALQAIQIENEVRAELSLPLRTEEAEDKRLFYNNLNEGEAYLDDLAAEIGLKVVDDPYTNQYIVTSEDNMTTGIFTVDLSGTYQEPGTNKVVVRKKEFQYQMNLDLKEGEIYLRKFVEKTLMQKIEWIEAEEKAVITLNDQTYTINPIKGEFDSYIINDRIAISQAKAYEFLNLDLSGGTSTVEVSLEGDAQEVIDDVADMSENSQDGAELDEAYLKELRFKLNMDIDDEEVYLRSYVEDMDGEITWNESEKTATIEMDGRKVDIKLGDHGSKIVNDRMVIEKDVIEDLLSDDNQKETEIFLKEDTNKSYESIQGFEKYLSQAGLGLGAIVLHKNREKILKMLHRKEENQCAQYFLQGVKLGLIECGFDPNSMLEYKQVNMKGVHEVAGYLARAAWSWESDEMLSLLELVEEDLRFIDNHVNASKKATICQNLGVSITNCMIASGVAGDLDNAQTVVKAYLSDTKRTEYKIQQMDRHTEMLVEMQKTLRESAEDFTRMIYSAKEDEDEYILKLWGLDKQVKVRKTMLNKTQEQSILKKAN